MTLQQIFGQLNHLSCEELDVLRAEIDRRLVEIECGAGNVDVDTILRSAADLTGGLSGEELDDMIVTVHDAHEAQNT